MLLLSPCCRRRLFTYIHLQIRWKTQILNFVFGFWLRTNVNSHRNSARKEFVCVVGNRTQWKIHFRKDMLAACQVSEQWCSGFICSGEQRGWDAEDLVRQSWLSVEWWVVLTWYAGKLERKILGSKVSFFFF